MNQKQRVGLISTLPTDHQFGQMMTILERREYILSSIWHGGTYTGTPLEF